MSNQLVYELDFGGCVRTTSKNYVNDLSHRPMSPHAPCANQHRLGRRPVDIR